MEKSPFKLYKQYLKEYNEMIDTKDNTEKTFRRITKMKKELQKMGLLPINKWGF